MNRAQLHSRRAELERFSHHRDRRICFGIIYFTDEAKAVEYGELMGRLGETYNGGYYHGRPCGRDKSWDYTTDSGTKLYASTY